MTEIEEQDRRRHRIKFCRWCATELDFDAAGIMREPRHVRGGDGKRRLEMFAFCKVECQRAFHAWEETQDETYHRQVEAPGGALQTRRGA